MEAVESSAVASVVSSTRPLNEKGASTTKTGTRNRCCSLCAPAPSSAPIVANALTTPVRRKGNAWAVVAVGSWWRLRGEYSKPNFFGFGNWFGHSHALEVHLPQRPGCGGDGTREVEREAVGFLAPRQLVLQRRRQCAQRGVASVETLRARAERAGISVEPASERFLHPSNESVPVGGCQVSVQLGWRLGGVGTLARGRNGRFAGGLSHRSNGDASV